MTVSTLRPNGTDLNSGVTRTGGAASDHATLNDDSDSTYMTSFGSTDGLSVDLDDFTLPAGAVVKNVQPRIRCALASSGSGSLTVAVVDGDVSGSEWGGSRPTITWTVPTTIWLPQITGLADADVDAAVLVMSGFGAVGTNVRVHEAFLDVTYVALPVVVIGAVTDPLTTTNRPTFGWVATLDSDGGVQTFYEVKVFTDAQYGAGGFDPDVDAATETSGITAGASTSWQVDGTLPDDTYRVYVRVAQTVNGTAHWSDWDFDEFTVNVALPAPPSITATADSPNGRIAVVIDDNAGTATTDELELQRSLDGGTTWETARQLVAGNFDVADAPITVYDYEAPNGTTVHYRARALHDYSGELAASDWATDTEAWTGTEWWVKHPHRPDLNADLKVRSYAQKERAGRAGTFQALGSTSAVVVQDTRETARGDFTLRLDSAADQDALDALLDEDATLLIQGPAGSGEPGYVRVLGHSRARQIDWEDGSKTFDTLQLVEVDSPPGDVVAWP